ncbi:VPS16 protein, partial [Grantiella picta]|nr:VPS16 protein [Grantiella picta]
EVLQNHVLEAQVFHTEFGTGVAILTGALRFSLATNIDDLKLRRLPEVPGLQKPPPCWTVLSQDRVTMVLLAVGQELFVLDNTSCSAVVREHGMGLHTLVPLSPGVLPRPSPEKFCEFNTGVRSPPKQMVCCPCPCMGWEWMGFKVSPTHSLLPVLVPAHGSGIRGQPWAGTASQPCFIPTPAEASQEIFRIASMAPGALLLEAQKEYEKESQKADEYLREIREQQLLPEAVGQCIEAAGYEHEPDTQKSLLRAASFGKCFLDKFPPEGFVHMCQDLRVLNAIRDYQIGIPLTFTHSKHLGTSPAQPNSSTPHTCPVCPPDPPVCPPVPSCPPRLVLRRLYPLAIRICEFLRLPEIQGVSRILAHWACYKVQQKDKSDEEVAQAINQKLGDTPGISYSDIATRAYDCGRAELAIKLLEYEPRSGEQVPLLLKMKRSKLALGKAIESGDTDLVYTVVLHLKNELNRGTFFMTLQNQPVALSLYRQ